jgi:hypothetical protein
MGYHSEALLSERLLREAGWAGKDAYPAHQEFLVELEGLLGFVQAHNRLNSFWPRLTSARPQERDDAVQEIRVARFLTANGFPVAQWEPPGKGRFIGEFSVHAPPSKPVFLEVKSPGWQGQLSQEERDAGRAQQEKYQGIEGGADDPWRAIRMSIRKAYPKFHSDQPNLLVIADDRFMPLATWGDLPAEQALFIRGTALEEVGYFTTREFENLSGVGLFKAESVVGQGLNYTFFLYTNPMARAETVLPDAFIAAFVRKRVANLT